MKTSQCEKRHLGEFLNRHEEIKRLIDKGYEEWHQGGCQSDRGCLLAMNNIKFLTELVQIREHAGLGNNGECFQCKGDKPCFIREEILVDAIQSEDVKK